MKDEDKTKEQLIEGSTIGGSCCPGNKLRQPDNGISSASGQLTVTRTGAAAAPPSTNLRRASGFFASIGRSGKELRDTASRAEKMSIDRRCAISTPLRKCMPHQYMGFASPKQSWGGRDCRATRLEIHNSGFPT